MQKTTFPRKHKQTKKKRDSTNILGRRGSQNKGLLFKGKKAERKKSEFT
jgi:hypothetical protein